MNVFVKLKLFLKYIVLVGYFHRHEFNRNFGLLTNTCSHNTTQQIHLSPSIYIDEILVFYQYLQYIMPRIHCHKIMQWFSYLVMIASAIDIIVQTWIFILACSSFWTYFSYLLKSSSSLCSSPSNSPLLPSAALHKHSSPPALQIFSTSHLLFSWMASVSC